MKYKILNNYRTTLLWLLAMVIGGILGGIVISSVVCVALLFIKNEQVKIETLVGLFIIIYFLGDNFSGVFSFAQNLRFVILVVGFIALYKYNLLERNIAKYIIPFSLVATLITYSLSPLGFEATLRGVSYFLVALVLFKAVQLLVISDVSRFYNLIFIILSLFFVLNIFLVFFPIIEVQYIKGRYAGIMANPNGLGMAAMFSYGIIEVLKKRKLLDISPNKITAFKVLLIGIIILTASRNSLLGVVVFEMSIRLLKYKLLLGVMLLITIYLYSTMTVLDVNAVVNNLGLTNYLRLDTIEDASGRTEVWAVAVEEIKNQPWLGKGMLYDSTYIKYYADRYIGDVRERHWGGIWNSYLSLLLNVGIVGLVTFSFFWYKMFALSKMKIVRFAFLMLCLFSAISESWMAASMNAFMPLVFICWGLQIYQPNSKIEKL